jgi:hypothetical protein
MLEIDNLSMTAVKCASSITLLLLIVPESIHSPNLNMPATDNAMPVNGSACGSATDESEINDLVTGRYRI